MALLYLFHALIQYSFLLYSICVVVNGKFLKRRFEVYWNIPSEPCMKNVSLRLDPSIYGIRTNDKQQFHGSEIVTFYEDQLGLYPKCNYEKDAETGKYVVTNCVNGGLPQNGDLVRHLKKAREDIERLIPSKKFSGPAVIDWEHWRPIYSLNWGGRTIYKALSSKDAKEKYPKMSEREAQNMGVELFNKAARTFMRETLVLGRKLRPLAQWGFYDYPLCNYDAGAKGEWECDPKYEDYNKQLNWMYEYVTAFYPPIYLHDANGSAEQEKRYVHARIVETRLTQSKLAKLRTPIYLFSKIEYDPYTMDTPFYNDHSICSSLDYPADYGVKGVILWSSSVNMRQRCSNITDYVQGVLGPKTIRIHDRVERCSAKMCNNHGRCLARESKGELKCGDDHFSEDYHCRCDTGYSGEYCERAEAWRRYRKYPPYYSPYRSQTRRKARQRRLSRSKSIRHSQN